MCSGRSTFIENLLELLHIGKIIDKTTILLIFKSSLDFSVALTEEHDTFLFAGLVVVLLDHIIFLFHLFLKIFAIFFTYFSNSYFIEMVESLSLAGSVDIFHFLIVEGTCLLQFLG